MILWLPKLLIALLPAILLAIAPLRAQPANVDTATAEGLVAYLGVMPAEIVKGHPAIHPEGAMHGGPPAGAHAYHVVIAVFDTASGDRVSDARVTAKISGLGLSGTEKILEPMAIADTATYGAFFDLPGADIYTIKVAIKRSGLQAPVVLEFRYDHLRE